MNQYDDELRDLNRALQRHPNDAAKLRRRGEVHRLLGRYGEALADLNRALEVEPNNALALRVRGETYWVLERYDEALADLNRALEWEPDDFWALGARGQVFKALGRTAEARRDLERALRLDPTQSWVKSELDTLPVRRPDADTALSDDDQRTTISLIRAKAPSSASGKSLAAILAQKRSAGEFDVFLCHNSKDKPDVKAIGEQLEALGVLPWLDEWELRPGFPWQEELERQIESIKSAAVFVGSSGFGPWQDMEQAAFLREFRRRRVPVIPVILESVKGDAPALPLFLRGMTWVDFRVKDPDPMRRLIWGILGERSR